MFRSLGRMFVLCQADELVTDLNADLARINTESQRNTSMKTMLDAKKTKLTDTLNTLSPQGVIQ